jgi:hypothetical protein
VERVTAVVHKLKYADSQSSMDRDALDRRNYMYRESTFWEECATKFIGRRASDHGTERRTLLSVCES